jgi:hypothetical protein
LQVKAFNKGWGAADPSVSAGNNFFAITGFGGEAPKDKGSESGSGFEESSDTSSDDSTYKSDGGSSEDGDLPDCEGDSFSRSSAEDDRSSFASGLHHSTPRSVSSAIGCKSECKDAMNESGD